MKRKNTTLAALTCASLLGSAALSQAAVLWSLDFNGYADGELSGAVGQPGFPGNWFNGSASVTTGVVTSGTTTATLNQSFSAAVGATGTIWLSFDWGHNGPGDQAGTYGGLTFFEDNYPALTEKGLLGNNWDSATWTGAAVSTIGMKTAVAQITLSDLGNETIKLWVGATGSPVNVSGTADATITGFEFSAVNALRVNGGNSQTFDNLKVGTTMLDVAAIPEPGSALLGGLGMLALLRRRR